MRDSHRMKWEENKDKWETESKETGKDKFSQTPSENPKVRLWFILQTHSSPRLHYLWSSVIFHRTRSPVKVCPRQTKSPLNDKDKTQHLGARKQSLKIHLPPDPNAAAAFCFQTSPQSERTQQVKECFHSWKLSSKEGLPSPCQYPDRGLVINLLVSIVWHRPPMASCSLPPSLKLSLHLCCNSQHPFICLGALTVLFARPSC